MEILNTFNKIFYKNNMLLCDKSELKLFFKNITANVLFDLMPLVHQVPDLIIQTAHFFKKRYTVFVSKFILENDPNGLINLIQFIFRHE